MTTPNTHVFFACGTLATENVIGQDIHDSQERNFLTSPNKARAHEAIY